MKKGPSKLAAQTELTIKLLAGKYSDAVIVILIGFFGATLSFLVFSQLPTFSLWEGSPLMHMSEVRMIRESFPVIPLWNNNWYFGNPFLRFYPPLSQYLMASTGWPLGLSMLQLYPIFTAAVFSALGIVTYYLCRILRFGRFESLASALLLVTSFNFFSFWDAGSNPNIVATLFSFISFVFAAKAIETGRTKYTLLTGIFLAAVALSHLQNLVIMVILFSLFAFIVSYFREELFEHTASKRSAIPFFIEASLLAGLLASWWFIPYIIEGGPFRALPYATLSAQTPESILAVFSARATQIIGADLQPNNLISPGILIFSIACISFIPMIKKRPPRRVALAIIFFSVTLLVILGLFSLLRIPVGLTERYSPYFSLFACILVGYALGMARDIISKLGHKVSYLIPVCILIGIIMFNSLAAISAFNYNRRPETSAPSYLVGLEQTANPGERIITDDIANMWKITAYSDFPQWGGSDYAAMTNEFAYWFWVKINYEKDTRFLSYFSRNFNVRFYMQPIGDMNPVDGAPGVWEVTHFNSSIVEKIDSHTKRILFIGRHIDYMNLFLSVSKLDPEDYLFAYGGALLNYDVETLKHFQAIYIDSQYALDPKSDVLPAYIESGGGVIFDTGLNPEETWASAPSYFPVSQLIPFQEVELNKTSFSSKIASNVNLTKNTEIYQAVELIQSDYEIIATVNDRTVMASRDFGSGRILVTGIGLPSIAIREERTREDVSRLLLDTIRFVIKNNAQPKMEFPTFNIGPTSVTVDLVNAQKDDAIWLKISNYPGWTATVDGQQLILFEGGPGFMLAFPNIQGDGTVVFTFSKTAYVVFAEIVSYMGIAYVVIRLFLSTRIAKKYQLREKIEDKLNISKKQPEKTAEQAEQNDS